MIKVGCFRCGKPMLVPNTYDKGEEGDICYSCDQELYAQWAETHLQPPIEDTGPL